MKRLCERQDGLSLFLDRSEFESWEDGIRNTGTNLGILPFPLNYYIIANDAELR